MFGKMKVPYLKKCCRCYTLKSGCKIIGWYGLVTSVISFLNGFHQLADFTSYDFPEVAVGLLKLKIIYCLVEVLFSFFLLMGLYLERTNYYLYWVIAKSLHLLCEIPLYIIMSNFDKLCPELGIFLLFMGLDIYSVLVVHGYFMEITNEVTYGESEV